jgi:formylglycine-generating enzyme required for sulfatase activity
VSWSNNVPVLNWGGATGDQFQVQFKANLQESAWTPLPAAVLTNGAAYSIVDTGVPGQGCRYYRVLRLPRLQVPDSMVWIPPGDFLMGTPASDSARTTNPLDTQAELSQFQVALTRGFWMSRSELTQWEYQDIMCGNPSAFSDDLNNPVESVNWTQAEYYCARLTQREQQAGRLPNDYAYRLPTEAEWEYVARAGTTGWFSFGDDLSLLHSYGWYTVDSASSPHPTGQLLPNPWGLSDMHGNVFEWCWDWIAAPPAGPVTDLIGQTNGILHAIRGGAWNSSWVDCRSSWRTGHVPTYANSALGLRVVLAPVP